MRVRFNLTKPKDVGLAVRRFLVFVLPALVIAGAITANMVMGLFKPVPEEKEETIKATPVVIAEARAEQVRLTITAQGEATPRRDISFSPQVSGKIVYMSPDFIAGGAFEEGEVLIRIDPTEYNYRVIQARSDVARSRSRFENEKAETKIARAEWEELGEGEGSALARREPQLAEAAALLASAEASLREAELQLARTTIKAPFKGRVRSKQVDVGEYVTPGDDLGEIFATDIMQVALPLTDSELGQLGLPIGFSETENDPGPAATLTALVAGQRRIWRGRVVRTDSGYDRETRVVFAYVEVADPYGAGADHGAPLAAGLFVSAAIEGRQIEEGVIIPRTALRGEDQVYIARDDDTLEIRKVVVASSNRREAILVGGVTPGERVITSPVRGVADGIAIAVAGAPEKSSPTVAEVTN